MPDSLAVLVDSLVRQSLAPAGQRQHQPFVENPWFKWGWPILTGLVAFVGARIVADHDRRRITRQNRTFTAEKAALFLRHASMMLTALDIRLEKEGAVIPGARSDEYAPARNVLEHLDTFDHVKSTLNDLQDNFLAKGIIDWHRMTSSELRELIDLRTMNPGRYLATHAPGRTETIPFRFEALRTSLAADKDNAKKLSDTLWVIAGRKAKETQAPKSE